MLERYLWNTLSSGICRIERFQEASDRVISCQLRKREYVWLTYNISNVLKLY